MGEAKIQVALDVQHRKQYANYGFELVIAKDGHSHS